MSDANNIWKANKEFLLQIIFFLTSIIIVVAISPRQGKFRYEFQKGKPWLMPSLIAPWDFPVLKSDNLVARERDSIIKNFSPYFRYDPEIYTKEIKEFDAYLMELRKSYESDNKVLSESDFNSAGRELKSILYDVFQKGILEVNDATSGIDLKRGEITIVKGKVGEQQKLSNVFGQKDAYQFVSAGKEELKKQFSSGGKLNLSEFTSTVALYNFTTPNLYYDLATSTAVKERLIKEISLNHGLIQEGELIIARGEILNDSKFMILESFKNAYEKRLGQNDKWLVILGRFILVTSCYFALYLFMYHYRQDILASIEKTFFIILIIMIFIMLTRMVVYLPNETVFLIPFAIIPIVIRTFYDSRLALFVHLVAIMLAGFIVPNSFEFIFMSYIAGVIALFSITSIYRRAKLFFTALMVFLTYTVVYFGMGIMQEGSIANMNWQNYIWFAGNGILLLLSYPLIFVFEKTFRFLSDATLFELSDTNQLLLRKLAAEAPGSFQHSLQVANLAEEAAREIGANHLLVRTGALYHDIGKIARPENFIENQVEGFSPHDNLDPLKSSKVIINHVNEGVELGRKYKLPTPLIDFIQTHHGTTVAYYFYKKFLDQNPQNTYMEKEFSYKGPKPFSKETAVVMMADAVEASSRSLANYSDNNINELVERIIYIQEQDGQYSDTPLTYKDISDIKNVFIKRLSNIYHARIAYPKREILKG
ncbi:MAG TPA: HDIG domain-containing protein [Bacteroidales bacterium]|nr:HDIG domain-containing protein [Bacteroidales bacterium]